MQTSQKPSRFQTHRATKHQSLLTSDIRPASMGTSLNTNEMLGVQPTRRGRIFVMLAGVAVAFGAGYWLVGISAEGDGQAPLSETVAEERAPEATSLALQRPLESLDKLAASGGPAAKAEPAVGASAVAKEASAPAGLAPRLEMTLTRKAEPELKAGQFSVDSAQLTPATEALLDQWTKRLKGDKRLTLEIAGHADERGTAQYNEMLGQRRANAARLYLLAKGVASKQIATASFGKRRPVAKGDNEAAWTKNRRIELKQASGKIVAKSGAAATKGASLVKGGSQVKKSGTKVAKGGNARAKSKGPSKSKTSARQSSRG